MEGTIHLSSTSVREPFALAHAGSASPALCRQEQAASNHVLTWIAHCPALAETFLAGTISSSAQACMTI